MNPLQACKFVNSLPAVSSGGAFTITAIDCLGYHYATIIFSCGAMSANAFTVMNLTGSNNDSTYGAITSSSQFSLTTAVPVAGTSTTDTTSFLTADSGQATTPNDNDNAIYVWFVDLRRATFSGATGSSAGTGVRYIKPAVTAGGTTVASIVAVLSANDPGLVSATDRGCRAICIV